MQGKSDRVDVFSVLSLLILWADLYDEGPVHRANLAKEGRSSGARGGGAEAAGGGVVGGGGLRLRGGGIEAEHFPR